MGHSESFAVVALLWLYLNNYSCISNGIFLFGCLKKEMAGNNYTIFLEETFLLTGFVGRSKNRINAKRS